jgi:hypothetical protein
MDRWEPESIVFLMDLWRNGTVAKRLALAREGVLTGDIFELEMRLDGDAMLAAEAMEEDFFRV